MNTVAAHQEPALTLDDLEAISDIYVWDVDDTAKAVKTAWVHKGRAKAIDVAGSQIEDWIIELLLEIQKSFSRAAGQNQFMIKKDGVLFRGSRHATNSGPLLALRRGATEVPLLDDLLLPTWWKQVLLQNQWARTGGLVLMAAQTGCGKSTTIASMVASRLMKFGGHCREISDPCEFPLHGMWGNGHCIQRDVDHSLPADEQFAGPMKDFLRAYPASSDGGRIMVVGEVRDQAAASELVRGACNGMLVVSTIHADSQATAVKRLCAMAQEEIGSFKLACDMVGASLRCVMSQSLHPNPRPDAVGWHRYKVKGGMLLSDGAQHAVGTNILNGDFHLLAQEQKRQKNLFENRKPGQAKLDDILTELGHKRGK